MPLQKDKISEQELLRAYPTYMRGPDDLEKLIYPSNFPQAGITIIKILELEKCHSWSLPNPDFLRFLNAAQTLWTIQEGGGNAENEELAEISSRCLAVLADLDLKNIPKVYL